MASKGLPKDQYGEEHAELASHALWAQVHGLAVLIGAGVLPWEEAHARLKFNLKIWLDGASASPGNGLSFGELSHRS